MMKLIKSIYLDSKNNEWVVERCTLPKRRGGEYIFFTAECSAYPTASFRFKSKNEILKAVDDFVNKKLN